MGKQLSQNCAPDSVSLSGTNSTWTENFDEYPEQRETYRGYFSAVFSDFFLFDPPLGLPDAAVTTRADEYLRQLKPGHKVQLKTRRFPPLSCPRDNASA